MSLINTSEIITNLENGDGQECAAIEVVNCTPRELRIARYPDGREVLQKAVHYTNGLECGFRWVDVPVVDVDY